MSPGTHIITGSVIRAGGTNLTIRSANGSERSFVVNPAGPYEAAMFPGDEVRVFYDPMQDGREFAARVQTLNVTANLGRAEQRRLMAAMSLPPTRSRELDQATLMAESGRGSDRTGDWTASGGEASGRAGSEWSASAASGSRAQSGEWSASADASGRTQGSDYAADYAADGSPDVSGRSGAMDEMPATASPIPAAGAVGALLLAASAGVSLIRRRMNL